MIIRPGDERDVRAAARLHIEQISEGFLSGLGMAFMTRLYRRIVRHEGSFLIVVEDGGAVVGMASGTVDVGALYRSFLLRDGVVAALRAAPRLMGAARRAVETLRYGSGGSNDGPAAELLAVAVDGPAHGRGVGRRLVTEAQAVFARLNATNVRVVAGVDNEPAIGLYRACGFRPVVRTEVHAGAVSQVLAWP